MASEPQTSGYLTVGDRALYATVHTPADVPRGGLVLLGPFGDERKSAYRLLVLLARAATQAGFAVVRFDFGGTGESGGQHRTATLAQWREETLGVLRQAARTCSAPAWYLVGVRLGGNLAVQAARQAPGELAGLVVVEPLLAGADYLRDLARRKQIKEMMGSGKAASSEDAMAADWQAGRAVDFDGFEVGPDLAAELRTLDLAADLAALPSVPGLRTQLVRVAGGKDFPPPWQPLVAHLRRNPASDAILVRDKPFWGQIDYYESDRIQNEILRFLAAGA